MSDLQESEYGAARDYTVGSPHLQHAPTRLRIENDLRELVAATLQRQATCRVLEVGAGHGTFTRTLVTAGAEVTVTEMSEPSARYLETIMAGAPVEVILDRQGTSALDVVTEREIDVLVFVSVLHHIPDYLGLIRQLVSELPRGASFYCAQDPLWYPSRSRWSRAREQVAYFGWRMGQGGYKRGLATRWRRLRGHYDEGSPADMVEYHVVRKGVDQAALARFLRTQFEDVRIHTYWSTQSRVWQAIGDRRGWASTFGITATNKSFGAS